MVVFRKQSFEIRRKIKSDFFDRSSTLSVLKCLFLSDTILRKRFDWCIIKGGG